MHVVTKELPGGHAVPNRIIGGMGVPLPPGSHLVSPPLEH